MRKNIYRYIRLLKDGFRKKFIAKRNFFNKCVYTMAMNKYWMFFLVGLWWVFFPLYVYEEQIDRKCNPRSFSFCPLNWSFSDIEVW
jgi:hypothetical protein